MKCFVYAVILLFFEKLKHPPQSYFNIKVQKSLKPTPSQRTGARSSISNMFPSVSSICLPLIIISIISFRYISCERSSACSLVFPKSNLRGVFKLFSVCRHQNSKQPSSPLALPLFSARRRKGDSQT